MEYIIRAQSKSNNIDNIYSAKQYWKQIKLNTVFFGFTIRCMKKINLTEILFVFDHVYNIFVLVLACDIEWKFIEEITNISIAPSDKKFFYYTTIARHDRHMQRSHPKINLLFI